MDDKEDIKRVSQKWGFGMAPLKDSHIAKTARAIEVFLAFIDNPHLQPTDDQLSCMSHVKGQFTRCAKQDQWDWFTVWTRIGRPSRGKCNKASNNIRNIREACKKQNSNQLTEAILTIRELDVHRYLHNFLYPRSDDSRVRYGQCAAQSKQRKKSMQYSLLIEFALIVSFFKLVISKPVK